MGVLILLEEPTAPMIKEAKGVGQYHHEDMGRGYDIISIVTAREIIEDGKRLEIPMSLDVLKSAQKDITDGQLSLI